MGDIDIFASELSDSEQLFQRLLEKVPVADARAKENQLKKLESNVASRNRTLNSLRSAVDSLPPGPSKTQFLSVLRTHTDELTRSRDSLRDLASAGANTRTNTTATSAGPAPVKVVGLNEAYDAAARVSHYQSGALRELDTGIGLVSDAQDVANEALVSLREQNEELDRVNEELRTMGGQLRRAKKELSQMFRRLFTDKLILGFLILILGAIVALVGVRFYFQIFRR